MVWLLQQWGGMRDIQKVKGNVLLKVHFFLNLCSSTVLKHVQYLMNLFPDARKYIKDFFVCPLCMCLSYVDLANRISHLTP